MIKNLLGKRISELRNRMNISQEGLAEMLDISQKSLSKIETGKNFMKAETLEKLLKAFNIKSYELFDFEHHDTPQHLVEEIYNHIEIIKTNPELLVTLFKITQALAKR